MIKLVLALGLWLAVSCACAQRPPGPFGGVRPGGGFPPPGGPPGMPGGGMPGGGPGNYGQPHQPPNNGYQPNYQPRFQPPPQPDYGPQYQRPYQPRPPQRRYPPELEGRRYEDQPRERPPDRLPEALPQDPYPPRGGWDRPPPEDGRPPDRGPGQPPGPPPGSPGGPPGPPPEPGPNRGGVPDWLIPALLLAAVPGILFMGRDEPRAARSEGLVAPTADMMEPALAKLAQGDHAGAIPMLQAAARNDPAQAPRARLLLALCFLKTGLPEVAVEEVRTLPLTDLPLERLYEVAQAFDAAGLPATARQLYMQILRVDVSFCDVASRVRSTSGATPVLPPGAPVMPPDDATGTQGALPERFVDVRFIARGGMGVVYEARDRELERRVAIKMLSPSFASDGEFVERFFRESRAMARLSHPSIVAVHDVARQPVPYIVMEFLDGSTLRHLLGTRALPYRQRLIVALAVTRALAYAHALGVVHRDVKPENVMVCADGRTKLLDFGIARLDAPGTAGTPKLTSASVVMGTPSYMAPELHNGVPASTRTDAYALGRVLHELVSAPEPDGAPAPKPGRELADVLDRLTSLDASRRPDDLGAVAEALDAELGRPAAPAVAADVMSFRTVRAALEEAYTRTLHGLKATLGVYRRCEKDPDKVFQYLLNAEAIAEVKERVRALVEGSLPALAKGAGGTDLEQLAGEVARYDWTGLLAELERLSQVPAGGRAAAVERLRALHSGVADLGSRVASALEAHVVRLGPIVEAAVRGVAGRERVRVTARGEPALSVPAPDRLVTDLREIVENLVNNSLEAQAKSVTVAVGADPGEVQLAVSDDGAGIPAERLPLLFESRHTTKTTGSGTGLQRVKTLCERYGGRAAATSRHGAGTTFTLTFPA